MNRKPGENGHAADGLELAGGRKTDNAAVKGAVDKSKVEELMPSLEVGATAEGGDQPSAEGRVQVGRGSKRLLVNGVVLMAGAALLSKLIGVFQKIPLQNMAGDRVFGIYNAVYPFYQLAASLATAGLPTAVSLLIAERLRKGNDTEGVRRTLYAALLLLGMTGIVSFGFMWAGSDHVARWIGDAETSGAIRSVSFALLLAPFVAALRGYMQGLGKMGLSAASQVVEQMVRVGVMLLVLGLSWSAGWAEASVASGVMSGSAFGGAAALLILAVSSWSKRTGERFSRKADALKEEIKKLAVIALPVALGAVVVPVLGVVDAFTVPRLLQVSGASEAHAMGMFGIYSRAQPLVQLVVMVAGAAAAALVPGLALARMRGAYGQLRTQLSLVERAAWAIGAAAAVGLVLLAEPLNIMLYEDAKGTLAFALIGCTALAGSVNAVTAPVLQSLGAVRIPAVLLLLAAVLKGVLNAVLVPSYGIEGAAIGGVVALSAAALLGTIAVRYHAAAAGASMTGTWGTMRGESYVGERTNAASRRSHEVSGGAEGASALATERWSDPASGGAEGASAAAVRGSDEVSGEAEGASATAERGSDEVSGGAEGASAAVERGSDEVSGEAEGASVAVKRRRDEASGEAEGASVAVKRRRDEASGVADGASATAERGSDEVSGEAEGASGAAKRRRWPAPGRAAAGTGFALAVMAAALLVAERALNAALGGLPPRAAAAALALTCVAVGACAFGAAALRGGAVSARELRALPGGGALAARLRRWRLIPPAKDES
ncbi:polysaccharide biosynthesis protein [Paenibacillus paridis]|uniref:polysaccharide biosynthesis protein n=1 Tax=Paenibacillus paridis TaxID=2583376 RepID=UPI00111EF7FE|nr:polysaccharide biosynthesis protein [Paenibacillus paridis]